MNARKGFISANAFDGMIPLLVVIGIGVGVVCIGLPLYALGYRMGKEAYHEHAIRMGAIVITYDQKTGEKVETWITVKK